jgi:two-component system OmpR family sensor kinase
MLRRRKWTLRTRLLLALLVLTAAGLTAFGALGVALLESSMLDRIDARLVSMATGMSAPDRPPPQPPAKISSRDRLPTDFRVLFFDAGGHVSGTVGQVNGDVTMPALPAMDVDSVRQRGPLVFTVQDESGHGRWRVRTAVQAPTPAQPVSGTVAVAQSLETIDATTEKLRTIELVGGSILLVLLGFTATLLIRLGLRPLTRIEHTAKAIADGELDRRVADDDPRTESGRLGAAFNVMLTRVSSALKERQLSEDRLRQFVGDASHELRTPLTSIRGFAELYRKGGGSPAVDVPRLMSRIESEAIQMGLLVDDLLLLAKLDQERMLDFAEVDLEVIAADAVHDAKAREPGRTITLRTPETPVRVLGDEYRLRQVVANLVTNALVHTPPDAAVEVAVRIEQSSPDGVTVQAGAPPPDIPAWAVLEVRDDGPGLTEDKARFVFDRFYRAGRTRATSGGAGLGLAIVAAILEAHSGAVQLRTSDGGGATFRVLLSPA